MDLRQTKSWGKYLSSINWKVENINGRQIFIKKLPLLPYSLIKIQRPKNPLPFLKINQLAKKHKALFVLIEPSQENFHEEIFFKMDYARSKMTQAHTATIQIIIPQTESLLWKSFSENARRNIKKALKNKLMIKTISLNKNKNDPAFKNFFGLLKNLTNQKKFYIPGYDEFHKKMLAFKKNSYLFEAFDNQKNLLASLWISISDNTAHYMHVGTNQDGYRFLANYLLVWESLKFAQKKGLKFYDFEGVYDPRFPKERRSWQKFTEFKKRFHGTIIEYPYPQIKFYNPLLKILYWSHYKIGL